VDAGFICDKVPCSLCYKKKHSVEHNFPLTVITFSGKYLCRMCFDFVHIIYEGTSYFTLDELGKNSHLTVVWIWYVAFTCSAYKIVYCKLFIEHFSRLQWI
jgi:hypothetical protein